MAKEIEKKYLVKQCNLNSLGEGVYYRQGYLSSKRECVVRVRKIGENAYLTVKSMNVGATRDEYEYSIPSEDADRMLSTLCEQPLIEKKRYKVAFENMIWEIDEFLGENKGLILAEIELTNENEVYALPPWIGKEVTDDPKYYNSNLIKYPYKDW